MGTYIYIYCTYATRYQKPAIRYRKPFFFNIFVGDGEKILIFFRTKRRANIDISGLAMSLKNRIKTTKNGNIDIYFFWYFLYGLYRIFLVFDSLGRLLESPFACKLLPASFWKCSSIPACCLRAAHEIVGLKLSCFRYVYSFEKHGLSPWNM